MSRASRFIALPRVSPASTASIARVLFAQHELEVRAQPVVLAEQVVQAAAAGSGSDQLEQHVNNSHASSTLRTPSEVEQPAFRARS